MTWKTLMTWKPIPGQSEKSKTCLEINEKINDFIFKSYRTQ